MKKIILIMILMVGSLAHSEDEDNTCTLLDNTKPALAKFHCVAGDKTYRVDCDISAAADATTGKWTTKNHKSGIELPAKDKDGQPIFAKCGERETSLGGTIHGEKMSVDVVEKLGHTYLVASEIFGRDDLKLRSIERSRVDVKLRSNERFVGQTTGFKCRDGADKILYAVISKSKAKRAEAFAPTRAWTTNEKAFKLMPVTDLKPIKCTWDRETEEEYPF